MRFEIAKAFAAALFSASLVAGVLPVAASADDAPAPDVARLSLVQGNVAVGRAGSTTNVAGVVNAPIEDGDALTAGAGARAEVQLDGTSVLRMDSGAQVRFATLDPNNRTIDVARGTVSLDLFDNASVLPEIDTPSATIRADEDGRYRVSVAEDGATFVTVRAGRAELDLPGGTQYVAPGTTMKIAGDASNPTYRVVALVPIDDFDRFNEARDSALIAALDTSNVPSDIAAGNLDAYGAWVYDPAYGEVWVPYANQTVGWAPYRDGSWSWGAQFGWTWVSYEPWGWAPYHYGRWFYNRGHGGWCWYPPRARRTPWAPALVAWLTFGNVNVGLGVGNVAWIPLAPWEPYHPWYGYDRHRGWHGTTIATTINVTNVGRHYRNFAQGGATAVTTRRFAQGDFRHNQPVTTGHLQHAIGYDGGMPMHGSAHNAAFNTTHALPAAMRVERFAMSRRSAPARPASGRPAPVAHVYTQVRPNTPARSNDVWASFAQSRRNAYAPQRTVDAQRRPVQTAPRPNDAWSRFTTDRDNYRAPQSPPQQRGHWQPQQRQQWQPQQRQQWQPQERQQSQPQQRQQWQPQQRSAPPPPQQRSAPPPRTDNRSNDRHDDSNGGHRH